MEEILNKKLTSRQKEVLTAITEYIEQNEIAPTVREIGDLTGIKSTSTVHGYLNRLEEGGFIEKRGAMPRTIRVLNRSQK